MLFFYSSLSLSGKDEILLSQTSDSLIVQFDIKSVDLAYESPWLGIYRKDEVLQNMYEQYKYLSEVKGEFLMAKLRYDDEAFLLLLFFLMYFLYSNSCVFPLI
jgi:hypothetical protein